MSEATDRMAAAVLELLQRRIDDIGRERDRLRVALEESVKLQSHYATLLNMHDGGERRPFDSVEAWLARLVETGTIEP